jgi:hypothetical protein
MMPKSVVRSASLLFMLAMGIVASGCNVTVTTTDRCDLDSSVICAYGGDGYSCTGSALPDSSLICSDGICTGDTCSFCCNPAVVVASTCGADNSVAGCEVGSYGYSCTGSDAPDSSNSNLFCSAGTPSGGKTLYCCLLTTSTSVGCASDAAVTAGCNGVGADYGFSCSGGATPDQTFDYLTCGAPGTDGSNLTYCCNITSTTTASSCSADPTLGCFGGSTGFTCSGSAVPSAANCSQPAVGPSGYTYYCCGGSAGTCAADTSVTGCQTGSTGYSCNGSANPGSSGLWCSEGIAATGGYTWYCCLNNTATTTCAQDSTVACTTPGAYGFACSGTDTPADANAALTCSAGTAGNDGNTLYCCQ